MTATTLDILVILALGILAGTGSGLLIGFLAGRQERAWAAMQKKDKIINLLLILACSSIIIAFLAWFLYWYPVT